MLSPLFQKLNLKAGTPGMLVLDAPPSFEAELAGLEGLLAVWRSPEEAGGAAFAMAFVTALEQVERVAAEVAGRLEGDAILWCCYPKGSSKRYTCGFNRDTGWAALGAQGWEPVRQVSIDEDWSALRFRRAAFIKTLSRRASMAISAEGKRRAGEGSGGE
jgi:hypothetical protein